MLGQLSHGLPKEKKAIASLEIIGENEINVD